MGGRPDIIFVIDTNKETIAVAEAKVLGIPVVAILDSNSDPSGITYPVPGNDDAIRSIKLYCELVANTVLDGISDEMKSAGVDVGEAENATEALPADGDDKAAVVKKPRSRARAPKKDGEGASA